MYVFLYRTYLMQDNNYFNSNKGISVNNNTLKLYLYNSFLIIIFQNVDKIKAASSNDRALAAQSTSQGATANQKRGRD